MIISVMLISVFSIWIIFFWLALQSMLQSPKLKSHKFKRNVQDRREIETKRKPDESKRRLPVISVILPARDEQENIKNVLILSCQTGLSELRILVVNDCSADSTGEILHKLASTYSDKSLTIIDPEPKPPGRVGKCWACFQGYKRSTGQVLLFTDADTIHAPDTLSLAIRQMIDENLDALTARQRITSDNTLTKIMLPLVWMVSHIAYSALKVNNSNSKAGFVFGGFYLITGDTYESLGTHQSVKNEIAVDLAIGEMLKLGKYRLRMFLGEENIEAFWALDSRSLHGALRRTILSAFRRQPIFTCFSVALQALMLVMPWINFACSLYWFTLSSSGSPMHSIDMGNIFSEFGRARNDFHKLLQFQDSILVVIPI